MPTPPDPIIPTVTADQPAQTPAGDYLAPPPVLRMPISRSLPILLLCATLLFNGLYLLILLGETSSRTTPGQIHLPVSLSLLVLQFFAIFRSHKWPTPALWLALAVALVGFWIVFVL